MVLEGLCGGCGGSFLLCCGSIVLLEGLCGGGGASFLLCGSIVVLEGLCGGGGAPFVWRRQWWFLSSLLRLHRGA